MESESYVSIVRRDRYCIVTISSSLGRSSELFSKDLRETAKEIVKRFVRQGRVVYDYHSSSDVVNFKVR
jgi:hypothetical protein